MGNYDSRCSATSLHVANASKAVSGSLSELPARFRISGSGAAEHVITAPLGQNPQALNDNSQSPKPKSPEPSFAQV